MRIRVRELRRPMGFCNPYFSVDEAVNDLATAGDLVDFFDLAPLHVERMSVGAQLRRGVKEDVILRGRAPRRARKGSRFRVRLTLQRRRGARHGSRSGARAALAQAGAHRLTISGGGGAFSEEALIEELIAMLDDELGGGGGSSKPETVRQLARRIHSIHRVPGIYARFGKRPSRLVRRSARRDL